MRAVEGIAISVGVLVLVLGAAAAPVAAVDHDHVRAVARICETGVTPEMAAGHDEFAAAFFSKGDRTERWGFAGFPPVRTLLVSVTRTTDGPHGKTTNFWGPRPLEEEKTNCIQAL
jgi:hypothetical protein